MGGTGLYARQQRAASKREGLLVCWLKSVHVDETNTLQMTLSRVSAIQRPVARSAPAAQPHLVLLPATAVSKAVACTPATDTPLPCIRSPLCCHDGVR
jgi:hypothetical protein